MSLTSPPALGWQVQKVSKDMQTLSEEKTALQLVVMVALAPQVAGATVSLQASSVTVMHQPVASLEGSTGPMAWAETAAARARAREAIANFIFDVKVCVWGWCGVMWCK